MKVRELIDQLHQFDPELEVVITYDSRFVVETEPVVRLSSRVEVYEHYWTPELNGLPQLVEVQA